MRTRAHYGNKPRTADQQRAALATELVLTGRLDALTVEELARRYGKVPLREISTMLAEARERAHGN